MESIKKLRRVTQPAESWKPWNLGVLRWPSIYPTWLCLRLGISANAVTYFRFFVGMLSVFLLLLGSLNALIASFVIFHFAIMLDTVDGQIFRYHVWKTGRKPSVLIGSWLDKTIDGSWRPLLLFAAGFGVFNATGNSWFLVLGSISAIMISLDQIIKLRLFDVLIYKQKLEYLKESKETISAESSGHMHNFYELFRVNNPFTLFWIAVLFARLDWFLLLYTPLICAVVCRTFWRQLKEVKRIDGEITKEKS